MNEAQRIEWKESWRDEYLRWICGFVNAEGGVLVIGRNDRGEVVGIEDARRLLEELTFLVIRDCGEILVAGEVASQATPEVVRVRAPRGELREKGLFEGRTGEATQEYYPRSYPRRILPLLRALPSPTRREWTTRNGIGPDAIGFAAGAVSPPRGGSEPERSPSA